MASNIVAEVAQMLVTASSPGSAVGIKEANVKLLEYKQKPGYLTILMQIYNTPNVAPQLRLLAAIEIKNLIFAEWEPSGDQDLISPEERQALKANIFDLMAAADEKEQKQFTNAIGLISNSDFPSGNWPELTDIIVAQLSKGELDRALIVMSALEHIVYRYRTEEGDVQLIAEIKHMHDTLWPTLLQLYTFTFSQISAALQQSDQAQLRKLLTLYTSIVETFYSLNSQDVAAFVQDNTKEWFEPMLTIAGALPSDALTERSDQNPTPIETAKAAVCNAYKLFTDRYEDVLSDTAIALHKMDKATLAANRQAIISARSDDAVAFQSTLVQNFIGQCFQMLVTLGTAPRYDVVVAAAMSFLTSIVSKEGYSKLLTPDHITQLCNNVVMPQLQIRDVDEELFTTNGEQYVQQDLLGSDVDTRRRTAADFVTGLLANFEELVTNNLKGHIATLLQQYEANPAQNWKAKDVAIYMIVALSVKGSTQLEGATILNQYVDIGTFFNTKILPELQVDDVNSLPFIRAACLKFVCVFRSQLPVDYLQGVFQLCCKFLASTEYVVHTYAAVTIDRILALTDPTTGGPRLGMETIMNVASSLLGSLYTILSTQPDSNQNEHVGRCILRTCAVVKDRVIQFAGPVIESTVAQLKHVAQHSSKGAFTHNMFEILACLVNSICGSDASQVSTFENLLFPVFEQMLATDVADFHPYVFQILAQMLEYRNDVPEPYARIYPGLVMVQSWENEGNIPALVRLLAAYFLRGFGNTLDEKQLQAVLGCFQQCNSKVKQAPFSFILLSSIFTDIDISKTYNFLPTLWQVIFKRLSAHKRPEYSEGVVCFWNVFVAKHGALAFLESVAKVSANVVNNVLGLWSRTMQTLSLPKDKKLVLRGTMVLLDYLFSTNQHPNHWSALVSGLLPMLQLTQSTKTVADFTSNLAVLTDQKQQIEEGKKEVQDLIESAQTMASNTFVRLVFAKGREKNYLEGFDLATAWPAFKTKNQQYLGTVAQQLGESYVALLQ